MKLFQIQRRPAMFQYPIRRSAELDRSTAPSLPGVPSTWKIQASFPDPSGWPWTYDRIRFVQFWPLETRLSGLITIWKPPGVLLTILGDLQGLRRTDQDQIALQAACKRGTVFTNNTGRVELIVANASRLSSKRLSVFLRVAFRSLAQEILPMTAGVRSWVADLIFFE